MKSCFIEGLLKEDRDTVATQLSMWRELHIWKIASNKLKGLSTQQDEVEKMLNIAKKNLIHKSIKDIRAELLVEYCNFLSIEWKYIKTVNDLDDLGLKIETSAISLQKQLSPKEFHGSDVNEVIQFNLIKIFDQLGDTYKKKSPEEKKKIISEIMKIIDEMPEDQRKILREKMNVDKITEKTIAQAITTGALGVAFASVVEIAGFSAYIFATKTLAAIAGLVGLTLPFGVYTALTSFIAFLSNPLVLILLVGILGTWLTHASNTKIKKSLFPYFFTQAYVSSSKEGESFKTAQQVLVSLQEMRIQE